MKKLSASISIYFALSIVLIISVILSVTELSRITCQRLYLQLATDTGIDSMLSLYHRKLYEYYNLYGVEYRTKDLLEKEYLSYVMPYFKDVTSDKKVANFYTADIDVDNINMVNELLIDKTYLEKEILAYEKYKLIGNVIEFLGKEILINDEKDIKTMLDASKDVFNEAMKSDIYKEIYTKYFDFADDIKTLENYAKKIPQYINETNSDIGSLRGVSTSGLLTNAKNVQKNVNAVSKSINNLVSTLDSYKEKMDEFRKVVKDKKSTYEVDKLSNKYDFTSEIIDFIEDEFEQFESYVDEESDMNRQVEYKKIECNEVKMVIDDMYENITYYVSNLQSVESTLKFEKAKKGDEKDVDYIEELNEEKRELQSECSDFIKEMKEEIRDVYIDTLVLETSSGAYQREENLLKKLIGFKDGILINFVLDESEISKINNDNINDKLINILSDNETISLDKILLGEYELDKFNYYNKGEGAFLEVERLLNGKSTDVQNLESTIGAILLIRIAMNVLHIYKNSEKRQLARSFTYTIFGGFSRLLAETMFLLIISAWGTAQGIYDVKKLLNNHKVNFMHDDSSWKVSVNKIIDIVGGMRIDIDETDDSGLAFSYKDYLRLLLLLSKQSDINSRMVAIIDRNIKKEQESFDISKMIYSFEVENKFSCKHFFTNLIFLGANDVKLYDEYFIKTCGYKSFLQ